MIEEVVYFNRELLGVRRDTPALLSSEEAKWLVTALREEVSEFIEAHDDQASVAHSTDALIDLIYFAIGGMARMGLSADQIKACFLTVHAANLMKKRGVKASRPQDGSVADAVKPQGWTDPVEVIKQILHD